MAKGARKRTDYKHPDNPQRREAKYRRNKGQKAIKKAGVSESEWASKTDPLFKVKGKERWLAINYN